jgi:hypothetical protein
MMQHAVFASLIHSLSLKRQGPVKATNLEKCYFKFPDPVHGSDPKAKNPMAWMILKAERQPQTKHAMTWQ